MKDADGKVTHLSITIKKWNGFSSASIMLGDFLIWASDQFKSGVKNYVSMEKTIDLSLVKNPLSGAPQKPEFVSAHEL